MSPSVVGPLLLVLVIVITDAWVGWDATTLKARGETVYVSLGRLTISEPLHWVLACLLLWIVFFPMYLAARRR